MRKSVFYLIAMVLVFSFASCGKEGADGPAGPEGKQGLEGKQGIPGTDGKMIHHGDDAPAGSVGNDGDFYIDKKNSNLYGPKNASGWGNPTSIKGADGSVGSPGAAGSQFLSGTSLPNDANDGKPGDFYFRSSTGELFGPKKADNTWAAGVNLKGPKGDPGEDGAANVFSSEWIDIKWDKMGNGPYGEHGYDLNKIITPMLKSGGVFLLYARGEVSSADISEQYPLPFSFFNGVVLDWDIIYSLRYVYEGTVLFINVHLANDPVFRQWHKDRLKQFRYMVIPSGVPISSSIPNPTASDWKRLSYDQTKKILNLKN